MFDNHNHTNSRKVKVISAQQLTPKAGCPSLELQVGCCEVGKRVYRRSQVPLHYTSNLRPGSRFSKKGGQGKARQAARGSRNPSSRRTPGLSTGDCDSHVNLEAKKCRLHLKALCVQSPRTPRQTQASRDVRTYCTELMTFNSGQLRQAGRSVLACSSKRCYHLCMM